MPRQNRHSTEFSGVYFVKLANENKSFFIRYKRHGKSIEERAGRGNEGWNAEKAWNLRSERISGINPQVGETQLNNGLNTGLRWTFSKIFEKYLRLRPDLKGRENEIYRFKNYLEMDFGDKTTQEVSQGDVERIRHNLQNRGLKPATVRHVLELLRRLANFAAKKNYCRGLSFKIDMPMVENQKTEDLTQDQIQKLLRVLDEEPEFQVSNLVRMALYTGMRRGELFALCWSDIDFYNKTITVKSGKNGLHPTIPLNEMAENVLAAHAQVETGSQFVFPGRGGKKRTECKRPLLRIRKKAGLPEDFRLLQGLRHVYASMLASSGKVDLETLQSLLTQKSPLMTQRYAHLFETPETVFATDYGDSESNEEVPETVFATDSADSESNEEVPETVFATDYADLEETAETMETDIAADYGDSEANEEVPETAIAADNVDSEQTEEVSETDLELIDKPETESESKTPELSQLVKQNYSGVKPKEIQHGEVYSPKTIVVEKKVQQKIKPSLKELKNDLKSLSQLIQAAPRKGKSTDPKWSHS